MNNMIRHQIWHRLPLLLLVFFLLALTPRAVQANAVNFQLNNQGLTLLSENQFHLGPFTLFVTPWLYTEKEKTSFGLKEGGIDLGLGSFHLTIGRQLNTFGPGRYAFPLLAPLGSGLTAEGLDQVAYSFSTKRLNYKKLYAWVPVEDHFRLLLGQRTTYDLGPFTLGFAETALAKEGAPDFYYLPLPLVPVGVYQLLAEHHLDLQEAKGALNLLAEVDLTIRLGANCKIYGGYLIDERPFLYWPEGASLTQWEYQAPDRKPWKVGYQAGGEWNRPLGINGLKFYTEYTRINQFTYTAKDPFFNYAYRGKILGGPLSPDSDQLNLELVTTANDTWEFGLAYTRRRQGEGRLGDQWTYQPGQTEVFLTGTVETTDQFALTAVKNLGLTNSDQVALTLSLARITNDDHQPGVVTLQPEVSVTGKVSW
jgi:hypothetical protein